MFGVNDAMVKLPQKTLMLWRIRLSVLFLLLCPVFTRFLFFWLPILILLYLLMFFWYLPTLFKSFTIFFDDKKLIVSYGALFCRQKVCRFAKTPTIYSFSSPIARLFKIELVFLRTVYGIIVLPETEHGSVIKYVKI